MRDHMFKTLKKASICLANEIDSYNADNMAKDVYNILDYFCHISELIELPGLMEADEYIKSESITKKYHILSRLIPLVLDGLPEDIIYDIGCSMYYADTLNFDAYDDEAHIPLINLIIVEGCASIARGDSTHIIKERLSAMIPKELGEHAKK